MIDYPFIPFLSASLVVWHQELPSANIINWMEWRPIPVSSGKARRGKEKRKFIFFSDQFRFPQEKLEGRGKERRKLFFFFVTIVFSLFPREFLLHLSTKTHEGKEDRGKFKFILWSINYKLICLSLVPFQSQFIPKLPIQNTFHTIVQPHLARFIPTPTPTPLSNNPLSA